MLLFFAHYVVANFDGAAALRSSTPQEPITRRRKHVTTTTEQSKKNEESLGEKKNLVQRIARALFDTFSKFMGVTSGIKVAEMNAKDPDDHFDPKRAGWNVVRFVQGYRGTPAHAYIPRSPLLVDGHQGLKNTLIFVTTILQLMWLWSLYALSVDHLPDKKIDTYSHPIGFSNESISYLIANAQTEAVVKAVAIFFAASRETGGIFMFAAPNVKEAYTQLRETDKNHSCFLTQFFLTCWTLTFFLFTQLPVTYTNILDTYYDKDVKLGLWPTLLTPHLSYSLSFSFYAWSKMYSNPLVYNTPILQVVGTLLPIVGGLGCILILLSAGNKGSNAELFGVENCINKSLLTDTDPTSLFFYDEKFGQHLSLGPVGTFCWPRSAFWAFETLAASAAVIFMPLAYLLQDLAKYSHRKVESACGNKVATWFQKLKLIKVAYNVLGGAFIVSLLYMYVFCIYRGHKAL